MEFNYVLRLEDLNESTLGFRQGEDVAFGAVLNFGFTSNNIHSKIESLIGLHTRNAILASKLHCSL